MSAAPHHRLALWLLIGVLLVGLVDRVAMHTGFDEERRLLADVAHEPVPDGIEINRDGVRDARAAEVFRAADHCILFLGDSFVFGEHLRSDEALPQRVEQLAREHLPDRTVRVANLGWSSSSPYLSHRRLERIGARYRPDLVVLCIDMSDMHDDIRYRIYDQRPGAFRWLGVLPSGVLSLQGAARRLGMHETLFGYPGERYFALERPLSASRRYFGPIEQSIEAIATHVVDELDAEFLLLIVPRAVQYGAQDSTPAGGEYVREPLRYFEELDERVDFPVRSLLPVFEATGVFPETFEGDPHWTAGGAAVAAEATWHILRREGLL